MAKKKSPFDLLPRIEARSFRYDGNDYETFVRRLTGNERIKLDQGQRVKMVRNTESGKFDISGDVDTADDRKRKYLLIYYAICNEDGSRKYANPQDVYDEEGPFLDELHRIANDFNTEETNEALGKPSVPSASVRSSD